MFYREDKVLSMVIIPSPGMPSRADMLRFVPFIGMLIPVKLLKAFNKNKQTVPGIADLKAFARGCLYLKRQCIRIRASMMGIFFKMGIAIHRKSELCNFFTYDILSNLILLIRYLYLARSISR